MKHYYFFQSIHILSFLFLAKGFQTVTTARKGSVTRLSAQSTSTRRQWLLQTNSALLFLTSAAPSYAAVTNDSQRTIYMTGKPPILPGESSQGKKNNNSNTQGTRKDPGFLRSISDCKSQCELQGSKSKEECLSECQDICCKTYEQCTFAIVPRI